MAMLNNQMVIPIAKYHLRVARTSFRVRRPGGTTTTATIV